MSALQRWPSGQQVIIVGCGSAGSRTARLLVQLGVPSYVITGVDINPSAVMPFGILVLNRWPPFAASIRPIVFICSSIDSHFENVELATKENARAVYIEKPIVGSFEQAGQLVYMASGTPVVVGYNWRFHPMFKDAQRIVETKNKRNIVANTVVSCDMSTWPGKYGDPVLECSHELDMMRSLFGNGKVVYSKRTDTMAFIVVSHETGALSTTEIRWDASYRRELTLSNDDGVLLRWGTVDFNNHGMGSKGPWGWTPDHMYLDTLWAFLGPVLRGESPHGCSVAEALDVVEWCETPRNL